MGLFGTWLRALTNTVSLTNAAPVSDSTGPTVGTGTKAARDDHQHPRLSSVGGGTLDTNLEAGITFTRSFAAKPMVSVGYEELANNLPIIFKVKSWVTDAGGNYVGCTIKGYRLQLLPASLTLVTNLQSFNVAAGTATGVSFGYLALQMS